MSLQIVDLRSRPSVMAAVIVLCLSGSRIVCHDSEVDALDALDVSVKGTFLQRGLEQWPMVWSHIPNEAI